MKARYYDATTARFISRDPNMPGATANAEETNPYLYAFNNPLTYADPTGANGGLLKKWWDKLFGGSDATDEKKEMKAAVNALVNEFNSVFDEFEMRDILDEVPGWEKGPFDDIWDLLDPIPMWTNLGHSTQFPPRVQEFTQAADRALNAKIAKIKGRLDANKKAFEALQIKAAEMQKRILGLQESLDTNKDLCPLARIEIEYEKSRLEMDAIYLRGSVAWITLKTEIAQLEAELGKLDKAQANAVKKLTDIGERWRKGFK